MYSLVVQLIVAVSVGCVSIVALVVHLVDILVSGTQHKYTCNMVNPVTMATS